MTDIPEHLLKRAQERRKEIGREIFNTLKEQSVDIADAQTYRSDARRVERSKPIERCQEGIRTFHLLRRGDESGVSGTGVVLEGAIFRSGQCVIHWLTPAPRGSLSIWDAFWLFLKIHVVSHPDNNTMIFFSDGEVWEHPQIANYVKEEEEK